MQNEEKNISNRGVQRRWGQDRVWDVLGIKSVYREERERGKKEE